MTYLPLAPLPQPESAPPGDATDLVRAIVFAIAGRPFALPMGAVLQVSQSPPHLKARLDGMGLVAYGDHTILLLNLYDRLDAQRTLPDGEVGQYLLLTQTRRQLCGVSIDAMPNLIDLPKGDVQPLPPTARKSHLQHVARFVVLARLPQRFGGAAADEPVPIYFLDVNRAVSYLGQS